MIHQSWILVEAFFILHSFPSRMQQWHRIVLVNWLIKSVQHLQVSQSIQHSRPLYTDVRKNVLPRVLYHQIKSKRSVWMNHLLRCLLDDNATMVMPFNHQDARTKMRLAAGRLSTKKHSSKELQVLPNEIQEWQEEATSLHSIQQFVRKQNRCVDNTLLTKHITQHSNMQAIQEDRTHREFVALVAMARKNAIVCHWW